MKKYITDIKTLAALLMAGVAFAACSSDENITNEAQQPAAPAKHYTMTVNATKGSDDTRALALDDKTLNVKWAETDQVSVFPQGTNTRLLGTLTAAASETGTTTLSGDLTGTVNVDDKLSLLFPRGEWDYTGQKGVLFSNENSIEKKYDYALADVTVESIDDDKIKTTDAHFTNQQAIVKFILKDKANGNALNAKKLTISAASNKLLTRKTLANTGDRIYHSGYTVTSGSGGIDGDDQNNLVDGDLSTKWCASSPWYIEFNTASPIKVDGYMLRTANDTEKYPGRNPKSWVLKGKANSGDDEWTTIDEKSDYDDMPATNFTERDFEATNPGTYQYFRLEISAVKDGDIMQLSEMKLFNDATEPTEFNDYGPVVVTPASAASELTVALRNENAGADTYTITAATADGETYKLEKTGVNFVNGKYYEITAKLTKQTTIDLSALTENKTIQDGYTLTGTLANYVQLTIADGATVTLDGVSINANGAWNSGRYAGISCLGDATIILKEGTTNTVGGDDVFPAIQGTENKTLTITGTGSLNALSNGRSAGIGSGYAAGQYNSKPKVCGDIVIAGGIITARGGSASAGIGAGNFGTCGKITISGGTVKAIGGNNAAGIGAGHRDSNGSCGNIEITGGTVEAIGGNNAAGIGTGERGICGSITISGGTVTAQGGSYAAGIGSGTSGTCGNITITNGVTKVTATKGWSPYPDTNSSIGKSPGSGTCGTVTIGGTEYAGGITTSPYTYQP